MFLKRIELQGFKSFADKSIITFDSDVIGIVGPNGCGKSNINDAIRWVLGEQSVKSLRGNNMSDVIFSGSTARKAVNMAEVTLVFDNSRHIMNVEFEEVEVTRRLHRTSGEGEYFINKAPCRLKDIINLVMDTGLGRDSLSIISQGNISAFADAKPEDRRALFEEAAGVAKYKKRKNESLSKLNRTQDNLSRLEDIITELERQVNPLKRQAKKAEVYLEKKKQLEVIEVSVLVDEIEKLSEQIDMLKKKGCGIIYISHKMDEILRISDDITVMRDGQWVATRPAKELTMEEIIKLMVGRELTNRFPPKTNKPGDVILDVQHIAGKYTRLKDATFQLRKGEVLGIAGLDGSGRTEVLENLFGAMTREGGTITLHGKEIQNRTPKESIKNGFALLTEERRATGIFGIRDIRENTVISSLKDYLMGGICLSDKQMKEKTEWAIQAMHIKTPSQKTQIRSLSGGNQQKVIIGRWLLTKPEVRLLDEPTRGIDVGAKYEIYQLIIDLANEGKGVIMVSSEMPELLGVCDRIIVMSGGQVAGEVDAKNTSQEEILTLAAKYV